MNSVQTTDADEDASDQTQQNTFSFTTVIVFGEGPVKPVLLEEEVSSKEKIAWYRFKADPSHFDEPDFWLIQQPRQLAELEKIEQNKELTAEEKSLQKESIRKNWQQKGWFAMKQWGRQNALAAGLALYKGLTKTVIVTGGRTISKEMKALLPEARLAEWPSEAELMADIIRTTYGDLYKKKYGRDIDEVIKIENDATNTLENFACSINKYPELLAENAKVGFLTADHHLDRVQGLAKLFSLNGNKLCAQEILKTLQLDDQEKMGEAFTSITTITSSETEILKNKSLLKGLQDPTYLTFWLGYVAMVKNPKVMHNIMQKFEDPDWYSCAEKIFTKIGLNLDDYQGKDLTKLAEKDAATFNYLISKLQELKKPEYRVIPPVNL
jgi:hypothetical protein